MTAVDQRMEDMSEGLDRVEVRLKERMTSLDIKAKTNAVKLRTIEMQKLNLEVESLRLAYEASERTAEDRQAMQARLDEIKLAMERLQSGRAEEEPTEGGAP